ncbi:hypothetical protein QZJ86_08355 [Methylomonas montana]|nr:hypothetical protein [Methylomonas montana]WKJ92138.1 hypothetical protein QZJ86_08355 [Methylomonas montana]
MNETESLEFFTAQAQAFAETLASRRGRDDLEDIRHNLCYML